MQGDYERESGRLPVPIMNRFQEDEQAIHQVRHQPGKKNIQKQKVVAISEWFDVSRLARRVTIRAPNSQSSS